MGKVIVKLNRQGIGELLKSQWAMNCCQEVADQVARRAGPDAETTQYVGKTRVNVSVGLTTPEARQDNLDNNTLLKALGV